MCLVEVEKMPKLAPANDIFVGRLGLLNQPKNSANL
jgi:hypothetical protein